MILAHIEVFNLCSQQITHEDKAPLKRMKTFMNLMLEVYKTYRFVHPDPQTSKQTLTMQSRHNSLPQSSHTFLSGNGANGAQEAPVLR